MAGVTKHIYEREIIDIIIRWNKEIKSIIPLLPECYTEVTILSSLKRFYPYEWKHAEDLYQYYVTKDRYLKRIKGRTRYNPVKPEILIKKAVWCKKVLSEKFKISHGETYSEEKRKAAEDELWAKRQIKIKRIDKRIEKALQYTQKVTPSYIDKLIGLYERKNTSMMDRFYILRDLKRYYNNKIIQFFFKRNDTELNQQLRMEAFYHLQSIGFNPRLRRGKYMLLHTKNKKRMEYLKNYSKEHYEIKGTPEELEYRIDNSKSEKIKEFDYFISHSSQDYNSVQQLISHENSNNKNVFCDWINDRDYLKRHLVCDATLKVLEKRMEESKSLLFVDSELSRKSIWCQYELNYFKALGKKIYVVRKESIDKGEYDIEEMSDNWYVNNDYQNLALLEGQKIGVK